MAAALPPVPSCEPAELRDRVAAGRPAVLRGLVARWPAVEAGRRSPAALAAHLRAQANDRPGEAWFAEPEIGGRFDFADGYRGLNHQRKAATVDQLLDLLLRQLDEPRPWGVYAGALPVAKHLPGFLAANPAPDVLDAGAPMLVSLWLGNRTRTAAHWDLPQNLACVVGGRRRFLLFPPDQVGNLYVGPLDTTLAGQASSQVDAERPDLARHPRYARALEAAQAAELEPGDALYVPSLWWHAVTAPDPLGAMVNFWWREGGALGETPMTALLHALVAVRGLPAAEREAWRALFDHYVFGGDPDALAHIPEEARGMLDRPSPAQLRQVKDRLIRSLR